MSQMSQWKLAESPMWAGVGTRWYQLPEWWLEKTEVTGDLLVNEQVLRVGRPVAEEIAGGPGMDSVFWRAQ